MSKNIGFILCGIHTEEFATITKDIPETESENIQLDLNVGFGIDADKKIIACLLNVKYMLKNEPFIILKLICEFEILDEAWDSFKFKKDSVLKIPKGLLHHLATITVGTARGVLHSKTSGKEYNKYFLPTINVTEIITKDSEFDLSI